MNANELADELDGFLKEQEQRPWGTKQVYLDQAATMLRQQQLKIDNLYENNARLDAEINALKKEAALQRLSDFTQEAECKPLAWAYIKDGEFWDAIHPDEHAQEEGSYTIPLYTHPVNPYPSITDTKIEPTVVSFTCPVKEHFEDEPQAEELHEIMQSNVELTDEEILDFINAFCLDMGDYWELTERNAIPMIRAILRKAQEK